MRILVACEFSGTVRDAFAARGHDAWSCDLLPSETPGNHYQGELQHFLTKRNTPIFDLMIAHPPCTDLAVSGSRWFKGKAAEQRVALEFVEWLMVGQYVNIPRICIENPVSIISSRIRKPDQVIQPHYFGDKAFKATCLWLKGLRPLMRTHHLDLPEKDTQDHREWSFIHRMAPGPNRAKERARTFHGTANAMAEQWGVQEDALDSPKVQPRLW